MTMIVAAATAMRGVRVRVPMETIVLATETTIHASALIEGGQGEPGASLATPGGGPQPLRRWRFLEPPGGEGHEVPLEEVAAWPQKWQSLTHSSSVMETGVGPGVGRGVVQLKSG